MVARIMSILQWAQERLHATHHAQKLRQLIFLFDLETEIDQTLLQVHGSRITSSTVYPDYSLFTISVDQTVTITESFYAPLSLAELFSSLGGALGLWLGLGVIQIVENAINFGGILYNAMYKNLTE